MKTTWPIGFSITLDGTTPQIRRGRYTLARCADCGELWWSDEVFANVCYGCWPGGRARW